MPLEHAGNNESEQNQGDHDATQAEYLHMYIYNVIINMLNGSYYSAGPHADISP